MDTTLSFIWTRVKSSIEPAPRLGHSLTKISGSKILLFGGEGKGETYLNDLWEIDHRGLQWEELDPKGDVPTGASEKRVGVEGMASDITTLPLTTHLVPR